MKFIKYIVIVLFVIIVAEVLYLFFIKVIKPDSQTTKRQIPTPASKAIVSPQPEKTGIELDENTLENIDTFYYDINPNMAIDPKVIYSHIFYKKGVTKASTIQNTHQGRVAEIDRTRKKAFFPYYDTLLTIRIVDETNSNVGITLNFSEQDLRKMIVLQDTEDTVVATSPDVLKIGDIIIIEDTIDATVSIPNENAKEDGYLTKSWGYNRIKTQITIIN